MPKLSLLTSVGEEMITIQRAMMLCGWGVKTGRGSVQMWINVLVAGKTEWSRPSLIRAIPERFRD